MTAAYRVPLALRLVIGFGILMVLNQTAPGTVQAILVLVAIYLVATHGGKAAALIASLPAALGSFLLPVKPSAGTAGGGGRPPVAL